MNNMVSELQIEFIEENGKNVSLDKQLVWMRQNNVNKVVLDLSSENAARLIQMEAKAIGIENVIGVILSKNLDNDFSAERKIISDLKMQSYIIDITNSLNAIIDQFHFNGIRENEDVRRCLLNNIETSVLNAVANHVNGVVVRSIDKNSMSI